MSEEKKFTKIIIGGTFDRFHVGHQFLIDVACSLARHIVIGITSTLFLENITQKKLSDKIQSFKTRKQSVERYLKQKKGQEWTTMPIDDKWGKAHELEADALIVSEETYPEGVRINRERKAQNRDSLILVVIPRVVDEEGRDYTSTRLRQEEMELS